MNNFDRPRRQENHNESGSKSVWIISIAIIIAGLVVAGALIYYKRSGSVDIKSVVSAHPEDTMPGVSPSDHILGNPNAPVVLVEYGDTDCPHCQDFHKTMQRIIDVYGKTGQVAWVYRHLAFNPKAPKEAEATECAAELGGNDKFWQYLDVLLSKKDFSITPYVGLDPAQLPTIAVSVGLDQQAFSKCLASGRYQQKVAASYDEALKAGAQATPFTVIITRNGRIPIVTGAISYENLNTAIQTLLNETPQQ